MKRIALIFSLLTVSACGGGGGGTGGTIAPANLSSAPGEATLVAYLQASHQTTLSATDTSGNSYTVQLNSASNAGTTTFNGSAPAYSTVDTIAFQKNGALVESGTSTSFYLLNPYVPLGETYSTGSPFALVSAYSPFPTTLNVGDAGSVATLTYYHDSTMAAVDASEEDTYTVEANNTATLLMCLNSVISNVTAQGGQDGLADSSESDCYSVDAAGNAVLVSIAVTVNGVTLNFM